MTRDWCNLNDWISPSFFLFGQKNTVFWLKIVIILEHQILINFLWILNEIVITGYYSVQSFIINVLAHKS